jgi:hypothetical protein
VARYRGKVARIYFHAVAGFANFDVYEYLEAEGIKYAIRLPANRVLQDRIGYLLKRPVGRPPNHVRRYYANFHYRAASWSKPRRVVAKVEWHPGELYPRVGFIVTNMARRAENVVAFYNKRGTCEQWIKEGKGAIKWTRLSCRSFAANAVRLRLHALAYNPGNFLRTLATPARPCQKSQNRAEIASIQRSSGECWLKVSKNGKTTVVGRVAALRHEIHHAVLLRGSGDDHSRHPGKVPRGSVQADDHLAVWRTQQDRPDYQGA